MAPDFREIDRELTGPGQPFEIVDGEVAGRRVRIWRNGIATYRQLLDASVAFGDATFLVFGDERWTFLRHIEEVAAWAAVLRDEYGIVPGDRIALAARNVLDWPAVFGAALAIGAVAVPLNGWWTPDELRYGLEHSGARVVAADGVRRKRIADAGCTAIEVIGIGPGDEGADGRALVDRVRGVPLPDVGVTGDDLATIFYTSGTTGRPKGVVGTHANLLVNPTNAFYLGARFARREGLDPAEVFRAAGQPSQLLSVPFFHATGCHSTLVCSLAMGGRIVLMGRWDAAEAVKLIRQEQVTTFSAVPALALELAAEIERQGVDVPSLRSVGFGGAPSPAELSRRLERVLPGRRSSNGYGMTETSGMVTLNSGADHVARPLSVGVPLPVYEARVVDDDGTVLPSGEPGELQLRGPGIVVGYWDDPAATDAVLSADGWLSTGDVAVIEDDGFLSIVDRAKDVIIRGGENISSSEIEGVLYDLAGVVEAAVVAVPHDILGEEPAAVVRCESGVELTADAVRDHVASHLARFKVPAVVVFTDQPLPRNATGKLLKAAVRQLVTA